MKTSKQGVAFVEGHEGFVSRAYPDPVGVLTIGTGFTNSSGVFRSFWGRKLKPGDTITRDQNRKILRAALRDEYEPPVLNAMPSKVKQHEFDAAVSAVVNLGARFTRWSIRFDQGRLSTHLRSSLMSAFARIMSFRIMAVIAFFGGFPAAMSFSYFVLRTGLKRMATMAGM